MNITIRKEERPVYLQIYKQMRNNILDGIFPFGSKLPSKRLLAAELHVSIVTVEHAYALLCDEGYAESRERSGYIVIFRPADGFAGAVSAAPALPAHSSASTYPSFSVSILSRTIRKVLADSHDILLERSPNAGLIELRDAIRQYLARNRSIQVDAEQIVVGSGAEYLYRLIVDLFGRDKIYAIESPAYDKLGQIYHAEGVSYEELPLVRDGIDSDAGLDLYGGLMSRLSRVYVPTAPEKVDGMVTEALGNGVLIPELTEIPEGVSYKCYLMMNP